MPGKLAKKLDVLENKTIAILDCGKRGGAPILKGISHQLGQNNKAVIVDFKKTSAHSCASKKLVDEIASVADAIVYGVVD